MKTIEIGGVRYRWKDILQLHREQKREQQKAQLKLFTLRDDTRPQSQQTVSGRYLEPTLFD